MGSFLVGLLDHVLPALGIGAADRLSDPRVASWLLRSTLDSCRPVAVGLPPGRRDHSLTTVIEGAQLLQVEVPFEIVERFIFDQPLAMEANEFGPPGRDSG